MSVYSVFCIVYVGSYTFLSPRSTATGGCKKKHTIFTVNIFHNSRGDILYTISFARYKKE